MCTLYLGKNHQRCYGSFRFHRIRWIWGDVCFSINKSLLSVKTLRYLPYEIKTDCCLQSEKSKERALAKATISISGLTLSILRVDAPKTTIIRISNVNPVSGATKVHSICDSFGKVKKVTGRYIDTFDIHFKLSEWSNMLKIINR